MNDEASSMSLRRMSEEGRTGQDRTDSTKGAKKSVSLYGGPFWGWRV